MATWAVSIRNGIKSRMILLENQENETDGQVFARAKTMKQMLKEKQPTYTIEIISRKIAFAKPVKIVLKHNDWWCPYCVHPRKFVQDDQLGVRKCVICGVSDSDFYVKKYNLDKYPLEDRYMYAVVEANKHLSMKGRIANGK